MLPLFLAGRNTARLKATHLIWSFFKSHALPKPGEAGPDAAQRPWVTPAVRAKGLSQRILYSKAAGAKVSYHVYLPVILKVHP